MTPTAAGAARLVAVALLVTALGALPSTSTAQPDVDERAAAQVVGRYAIDSQPGGAVWSFEKDGKVVIIGPGELMAGGDWQPGPLAGLFHGEVHVPVTSQWLAILGAVSPDGDQVAMHVLASEAGAPGDGVPWPATSFLVGRRVGLLPDDGSSAARSPEASASSEP